MIRTEDPSFEETVGRYLVVVELAAACQNTK